LTKDMVNRVVSEVEKKVSEIENNLKWYLKKQ
jgi:hypothetical protein